MDDKSRFIEDLLDDFGDLESLAELKLAYESGNSEKLSERWLFTRAIELGKSTHSSRLWYLVALNWWTWTCYDPNSELKNYYRFYRIPRDMAIEALHRSFKEVNMKSAHKAERSVDLLIEKAKQHYAEKEGSTATGSS